MRPLTSRDPRLAAGDAAHQPLARAVARGAARGADLRRHLRARPRRPRRRLHAAVVGDPARRRRRAPDPHDDGGRRDHGRRRRLLDHDRRADAGLDPVRPADASQLHPRPRHPAHAGRVRRDVRLLGAGARRDRQRHAQPVRAEHLDHRRAARARARHGRADLLHQPHHQLDPAAAGDRQHRPRPRRRDRRRGLARRNRPRAPDRPVGQRDRAQHGRVERRRAHGATAATSSSSTTTRWCGSRAARTP